MAGIVELDEGDSADWLHLLRPETMAKERAIHDSLSPGGGRGGGRRRRPLTEHYGPGPHPSGTPQLAHAGGRSARRARAFAALTRAGIHTDPALVKPRRGWGSTRADPAFRGVRPDELIDELGRRSEPITGRPVDDEPNRRLRGELRRRGYNPDTGERRGANYGSLPRLRGLPKAETREADAARHRLMPLIDLEVSRRLARGEDRATVHGVRDVIASENRARWWAKHAQDTPHQLFDQVRLMSELGYQREAGWARHGGRTPSPAQRKRRRAA